MTTTNSQNWRYSFLFPFKLHHFKGNSKFLAQKVSIVISELVITLVKLGHWTRRDNGPVTTVHLGAAFPNSKYNDPRKPIV